MSQKWHISHVLSSVPDRTVSTTRSFLKIVIHLQCKISKERERVCVYETHQDKKKQSTSTDGHYLCTTLTPRDGDSQTMRLTAYRSRPPFPSPYTRCFRVTPQRLPTQSNAAKTQRPSTSHESSSASKITKTADSVPRSTDWLHRRPAARKPPVIKYSRGSGCL